MKNKILFVGFFILLFFIIMSIPVYAQETILDTTVTFKGVNLTPYQIIKTIQKSFPIIIYTENLQEKKSDLNLEYVKLDKIFNEITKNNNLNYKMLGNKVYVDNQKNINQIVKKYEKKFDHKYVAFERLSKKEVENTIKENNLNIHFKYINEGLFKLEGLNKDLDYIIPKLSKESEKKKNNSKYHYITVENINKAKSYIKKNYPEIKVLNSQTEKTLILFITEKEKKSLIKEI